LQIMDAQCTLVHFLQEELADGVLLDLLLASVGITGGKVGEVEVRAPNFNRVAYEREAGLN